MTYGQMCLGILIFCMVITGILFVLFGEITVRRLRKNPATRDELGIEFVNGRDIMNVAMALSMPRKLNRKAKNSRAADLFADADILYQYTSRFDRILARLLYVSFLICVIDIIIIIIIAKLE